jgi:hypothetical protein
MTLKLKEKFTPQGGGDAVHLPTLRALCQSLAKVTINLGLYEREATLRGTNEHDLDFVQALVCYLTHHLEALSDRLENQHGRPTKN